ncbi:hypothetical protein FHT80_004957 [Rhizobium sp. BK226]|uniref:hypothetical protein n=1 Tax=Rhizobium anhuiense TaxID=1184720 RepID=UPI0017DC0319|nr:hypothetical protein [Rhizobium anhuiense]MBB4115589.1 hypothetical protein [Rhizobium sp. BK226]MBB4255038.1 hypothetical protein [Rhizobium sp. BK008]
MHTRQKAKRVPKFCVQDFQDISDSAPGICTLGMQTERKLSECRQLVVNPDRRRPPKAHKAPSSRKAACGKTGSAEEWQRKTARKGTLAEFLMQSPLRGADLDPERQRDEPRDLQL